MNNSCSQLSLDFYQKKPLEVQFSGLDLSSDSGLLLIRQGEQNKKICEGIANCLEDNREPGKIKHSLQELVSQRVYQIAAGYEDTNDSNYLRHDPIFKIACERLPISGENLLASQPTMSRWENQIKKKEQSAIRRLFVERFISSYEEEPEEIVLDIDGWDDPTHGNQQLSFFHGYYGHYMYYPVLINEALSGYPLVLQLRAGNSHPGKGVAGILRWLFWQLKKAWPQVKIILRGDGGFSLPEIIRLCERSQVDYAFGFNSNAVLKRKINYLLDKARLEYIRTGEKAHRPRRGFLGVRTEQEARLFDDVYYAAKSWAQPRRIIMKAEWLEKGANPRFVLTNMNTEAQRLYDQFYVQRGASSEHRIKELKLGIKADRLSCQSFMVNQFRLFLSQAAYILMLTEARSRAGNKTRASVQ